MLNIAIELSSPKRLVPLSWTGLTIVPSMSSIDGPLYHLLEAEERQAAIEHCLRILKRGGYIFAASSVLMPNMLVVKNGPNDCRILIT